MQAEFKILTAAQVAKSEKQTIDSGAALETLMERAGAAVYQHIITKYPPQPTQVVCGPGNNGEDGYVVARLLKQQGWPVQVVATPLKQVSPAAKEWTDLTLEFDPSSIKEGALIVDGIFGTGLKYQLDGIYAQMVEALNQKADHIISIDIPSGIHTDTADVMGVAIKANATVTFNFRKPAHVLLPGRQYCGNLTIYDIGLEALDADEIHVYLNNPILWQQLYSLPDETTHKYMRGFLHILGGSEMTGAARFAADAARRMGTGMVLIASLEKAQAIYEAECAGVLTKSIHKPEEFADNEQATVALIGPGSGRTDFTKSVVLAWLKTGKPCVLDADALYVFKDNADELFKMIKGPVVLTPHEGEFSRLFKAMGSKIERAQQAATQSGAVVLLKGADTVIADPKGLTLVQDHSSAFLATGGTGDILAGMIASLLGQGLDGLSASGFATWVHSQIAENIGLGFLAEDMPANIPIILKEILSRD